MGIRFQCHACGENLHVKASLAGRRGICPHCQAKVEIPAGEAGTPDAASASKEEPAPTADLTTETFAAEDPLATHTHLRWYVGSAAGERYGPALPPAMRQWLEEGRIDRETLVWREGWPEWRKAGQVFPRFAAPNHAEAPRPSIAGLPEPTTVGEPVKVVGAAARPASMRSSRRSTTGGVIATVVLVIAMLVLLPILIYVLVHQPDGKPTALAPTHAPATTHGI